MAFLQIISNNILPLIVFIAIGYILDIIFTLDVKTLNKLGIGLTTEPKYGNKKL